jgi:L-amino acid N-acyltransferase YncA
LREWLRQDGVPPIARSRIVVVANDQGIWWAPAIERPPRDAPQVSEESIYLDVDDRRRGSHS